MSPPATVTPAETLNNEPQRRFSLTRKLVLLTMFCFASFLDVFNNSALFPAIPILENSMGIIQSQSTWIISAYQLTFASSLFISGRISDVYNPKNAFVVGVFLLGIFSFGGGFVENQIVIIVLRAFMGIVAAMTIPSSLALLVRIFPEPDEQARAIAMFGGCGAFGNVLGLLIGALLIQYTSYHWVFWFVGIIAIPIALGCLFIIPSEIANLPNESDARGAKWKSLDLIGVSILTAALILFIYAMTSGSLDNWYSAGVLTPLIISALLIVVFFYWETLIPPENAAIPPRTWFYTNFSVLFAAALYPLCWWSAVFMVFMTLWQDVFQWTVISTAIHMLPLGVAGFLMTLTGALSGVCSPKWIILTAFSMVTVATILLALGGSQPDGYWPYIFPAFTLGASGVVLIYTHTNIAIFRTTPPSMAGTVGAMFNGALEIGSAIGLAVFNSIQASVTATEGEDRGQAAAFWFLFAATLIEILCISYFYCTSTDREPELNSDDGNDTVRGSEDVSTEVNEVKGGTTVMKEGSNSQPV